ncbi:hypothetical protein QYE76_022014 [Lolium multiflorum]|uniref:Retrotransposon gag domain-containing protein n=1 Tax=Lolium multiflorum TaxID=4521 RepID=A0AAD8RA58_LOLMU|nr:hypothetical protein QYE76_022014 [Lolium multiflorum]
MAEEPVKYEDLPEHKKKYDDLKAILEPSSSALLRKPVRTGSSSKGSNPKSLVNTLERVTLNVVQEIMKHKYSPSGPALGTHQGEIPLYTRPPLQYTFAAPQQQGSPAYVVYKVGGDPGDNSCHERSTCSSTVDEITAIMRDQFGILPKKRMIGYSKPYPNEYDLIPLPPKYRLPDFTKFSGSEGTSSIEHVSRYLAQLVRQRRGETVSEYIQCFRAVRNRCYSVRLSEKEACELAIAGLSAPLKDVTFQDEYNSLAHMVQKLSV